MKIAIILFNLGGPDSLEAVQPFLRNLFGDPAILRVPGFIRAPLASFLARRRWSRESFRTFRELFARVRARGDYPYYVALACVDSTSC